MEPRESDRLQGSRTPSGLIPGIILVAIGALFFLNNLHIVYIKDWVRFWPAVLVAVGVVKLVDSLDSGGRAAGGALIAVGALLLAQTLGYLDGMSLFDLWPLILIVVGVVLLFQRSIPWPDTFSMNSSNTDAGVLNEAAVFGGGKRNVVTEDFRGGKVSAVFGGFELDLRRAVMTADSAVLHIDAVFGGVEIRIPQNWAAVVRGTGVFGGYSDESLQPNESTPGYKRLILKGSAVFGGVSVKN